MRLAIVIFILAGLSIETSIAQEDINEVISKVKTPSSPGSQILNKQPNSISRPKSWNELEVGLFTDLLNEDGNVNFNKLIDVEFSPYWLKKDREISTEDYILQGNLLENARQNFTVSLSTTSNLIIPDSVNNSNTALGIGVRTMIWKGTKLEKAELERRYQVLRADLMNSVRLLVMIDQVECDNCKREDYVSSVLEIIRNNKGSLFPEDANGEIVDENIDRFEVHLLENLPEESVDGADYKAYIDNLGESDYFSTLAPNLLKLEEMLADRKGFKLEVAAALALDFPTNETDFSVIPQYSFWLTPSYQPFDTEWIEFLGVVRYQGFELDYYKDVLQLDEYNKSAFDLGVKLVLKSPRISFELEGVSRRATNSVLMNGAFVNVTESDNKYVARLNYQISKGIVISYDFGKGFDVVGQPDSLISQFALNFALGAFNLKNLEK